MKFPIIATAIFIALAGPAVAAVDDCSGQYQDGKAPVLVNEKLAAGTRPLCYGAFAVLHSGVTRTPLYSAEHLTKSRVLAASTVRRTNAFHTESGLPAADRAEISDYALSGFDRGHMAPSGDMPSPASQAESFTLANMVPQAPELNRGLWEGIESAVRTLTERDGDVYVVTGPVFRGESLKRIHGRVMVPTDVWKAVFDPKRGAAAYLAPNDASGKVETVSITQLQQVTGIDVFPGLSQAVKDKEADLPKATPHGYGHQANAGDGGVVGAVRSLIRQLR